MATATKPRYVDTSNAALAIDCPHCGLLTSRFIEFCRNCSYQLWPSGVVASAAFAAWRDTDPVRSCARQYDLTLPEGDGPLLADYEARAHELGIHLFPSSNWPFTICLGLLFLGVAAVPFNSTARIILAAIGALVFLAGVVGWVIVEDVRMYPGDPTLTETPAGHTDPSTHHQE